MAENIGKIVVSIEAEVAALRDGLARAEVEFKKSADRLAAEQSKLSNRFKKSWTELASKVRVIGMVGDIALKTWKSIDGVLSVVTDSTLNASQKITGTMDSVVESGVPIVSQFLQIGRGLHGWISGEKKLREEIQKTRKAAEVRANKQLAAFNEQLAKRKELSGFTEDILKILEDEAEMASETSERKKKLLEQERSRAALLLAFEEKLRTASKDTTQEYLDNEKEKFDKALKLFDEAQARELREFDKLQIDKADSAAAAIAERHRKEMEALEKEKQAKIDAAKEVADKTLDLQTQLNIMIAKQAGDDEKARTLAIEARYKKMSEGATAAQQKIIQQMKEIELAGITPTAGAGGGGGTTTVSTAVGSFTVASGAIETKKQTSLLKRIANATEKMGDQSTGVSVILAA